MISDIVLEVLLWVAIVFGLISIGASLYGIYMKWVGRW